MKPKFIKGVPAYDAIGVKRVCLDLSDGRDSVVFNLTGGTKLEILGAFAAAEHRGAPVAYIAFREGKVYLIEGEQHRTEPIHDSVYQKIDVASYLMAHGVIIGSEERSKRLRMLFDQAAYLAEQVETVHWLSAKLRYALHTDQWSEFDVRGQTRSVLARLADWGYVEGEVSRGRAKARLTHNGEEFLAGPWLEYFAASHIGPLRPDDMAFRVPIRLGQPDRQIDTEIDVAVTMRARLYIVSCKTASIRNKKDPDIYVDHLDELRALAPILGGRFCRAVLVTSEDFTLPHARRVVDRARIYGIPVVDRSAFSNLRAVFNVLLGPF